MASKSQKKRDKRITREIHRLYWKANFQRPLELILCYVFRLPAFILVHTIMPLIIALAIEDIFNKNLDNVIVHVWQLVFVILAFCICWAIAGLVIPRNGVAAGDFVQRKVFSNFLEKDYSFYTNT